MLKSYNFRIYPTKFQRTKIEKTRIYAEGPVTKP
ncbi:MAG TPA: helix-turn-helix domain-containing protein [Methanothrix sp.]|nr:helix-turn-helix domain-containing protein [Methanothrix sp.]HPT36931.1 helix-turn-helix domain-containing protein [Methanothrix sp.]